jgi:hypothetical protein
MLSFRFYRIIFFLISEFEESTITILLKKNLFDSKKFNVLVNSTILFLVGITISIYLLLNNIILFKN